MGKVASRISRHSLRNRSCWGNESILAAVRQEGRLRLFLDGKQMSSTLFSAESQAGKIVGPEWVRVDQPATATAEEFVFNGHRYQFVAEKCS